MIKTHEELLKLHGRKVSCEILGEKIEDAKIAVEENMVFVCQNRKDRGEPDDKLGYEYAWWISDVGYEYEYFGRECTNITLIDEPAQSKTSKPTLITVQKEIKKYTDDTTLYAKDSITFNDKEYSTLEWNEFVERVRRVNKKFNSLRK